MPTTPATPGGIDPAASTTPLPTVGPTPHLSTRTLAWLTNHPLAHAVIRSVWDKLTDLEHADHDPGVLAALRGVLAHHQPTSGGRCGTCRRLTWPHLWRRRPFPCLVWHQVRCDLLGPLVDRSRHRHRQPTGRDA